MQSNRNWDSLKLQTTGSSPATYPDRPVAIAPPVARLQPLESVIHGDRRVDPYFWLREKENSEVLEHLRAENAYTDAFMRPTEPLQEMLYQEMLGRIQQTDLSVPYRLRGYLYYTRTEEGHQYPIHCRRLDTDHALEEVLLDLNILAEGHSFLGLGSFDISDDNQLLAYSIDTTGFRQYTLQIKNLRTGHTLPLRRERVTSTAWAADNRNLFYTIEDPVTKRSDQLFRLLLTSVEADASQPEAANDALLYHEIDERFRVAVDRSRSGNYLFLVVASHTASEVHFLRAEQPCSKFRPITPREDEHEYYVDHHPGRAFSSDGGIFYIRTNSGGRTFHLVTAPAADPRRENWREFIPNRPRVMLASADVFDAHLVLVEREDGLPSLRIVDLTSSAPHPLDASYRISFNEPAFSASLGANPEFRSHQVRFFYESFITPRSVYDYDIVTRSRTLLKQQPVLGGYDPALYTSERIHAIAPDGTQIPISLVAHRDTPINAKATAPLLLYGYGSYGISIPVSFSSNRLSLLNRGVIFAIAHIRGGGEMGKPWHDAGRMRSKMNTFTDFIAAAEHLIAKGYTSPEKLIIEGGSAGGLLMGAVTNLRPDLFRIVITHVPFVDVLNTMLDASLPLTVGEYEEWGNPQLPEEYALMKSYCPYTNISRKNYPSILAKTGLNDSQVMYWEPAKYVAKLRAMKTGANPLLFKINMGAGHGGASGRYDYLREIAFDYAFILSQLRIAD